MEPTGLAGPPAEQATDTEALALAPSPRNRAGSSLALQAGLPCATCGSAAGPAADDAVASGAPHVYALGRIEARFPNLAAEKEFAQASGRTDTAEKTDQETFHAVLSEPDNRYLVRQLCWVLTIQGLETYLLRPRDPADIDLLVHAIRPAPSPGDLDIVIGWRGPIAPPELCNGLMVPIVAFDQIYSFDRDALIKAIPKPEKTSAERFRPAAEQLFNMIMQMTDNAGATSEHCALNYLAMRYPGIYATAVDSLSPGAAAAIHPSAQDLR